MKFYNTPIGKIVGWGTHDIVNASAGIGGYLHSLKYKLDKKEEISSEELEKAVVGMMNSMKRIQEGTDYIYEKLKDLQEREAWK